MKNLMILVSYYYGLILFFLGEIVYNNLAVIYCYFVNSFDIYNDLYNIEELFKK